MEKNPSTTENSLHLASFDTIVLDLDGVITRTATVHAAAWKAMFDDFLSHHEVQGQGTSFSVDNDYRRYVDGKSRFDGVRSFLKSRGITLPEGDPDDPPDKETVYGLGKRKNQLFLKMLAKDGVDVYESTLSLLNELRRNGYRTAVVSSSRNCREVLRACGITGLLDARVDGIDLERGDMNGKPAPDMFIEACRRIDCEPQKAVAVEDAVSGIEAARAARFGCVIGIDRDAAKQALRRHGADMVVSDLAEIRLIKGEETGLQNRELPSAFDCLDKLVPENGEKVVLFLDYDGTLTPIVSHPDDAVLSEAMRRTLQRLAGLCQLAIISGRDLSDVRERVDVEGIWYAGSHGFDIAGPETQQKVYQEGTDFLPRLDEAEEALHERIDLITGSLIERKRFSIAIHYRQVADADVATLQRIVEEIHSDYPDLKLSQGKKLFELQPAIDWDKGKALQWMMRYLAIEPERAVVVYIGDDTTDEDAFRAIAPAGIGILVAKEDKPSRASCYLQDPAAVERFLQQLAETLKEAANG